MKYNACTCNFILFIIKCHTFLHEKKKKNNNIITYSVQILLQVTKKNITLQKKIYKKNCDSNSF
jgi:hypothetical protein